jgi:c-di-GMP-binding flagellar brake protein YcgR
MISKKLNKNKSSWALYSILENKKEKKENFICWRMINGSKQVAEVSLSIIRKSREEIVIKAVGEKNEKALLDIVTGAETVNFFLQEDKVLFQSVIKSSSGQGKLTVSLPREFAHIDRRNHVRLQLYDDITSTLSFKKESHYSQHKTNQLFEKKCFDLSAGGLSFIVSRVEARFFKKNDPIHSIALVMNNKTIMCAAKVVTILDVEPNDRNKLNYKAHKVCLEFTVISEQDRKCIGEYVFKYVDLDEVC